MNYRVFNTPTFTERARMKDANIKFAQRRKYALVRRLTKMSQMLQRVIQHVE